MASLTSEDESSDDGYSISSSNSNDSTTRSGNNQNQSFSSNDYNSPIFSVKRQNLVLKIRSRQLYGRFTKSSRGKDEKVFSSSIHPRCRKSLSALLSNHNSRYHIFMGFSLCGQYFLSYTETQNQANQAQSRLSIFDECEYKYDLHIWRFVPGKKLQFISKHRIFNHLKCGSVLDKIMFMQFPSDVHKIVCYGYDEASNSDLLHISIITIPSQKFCVHCEDPLNLIKDSSHKPLCMKHGFVVDYMFALSQPAPVFDPQISLSYPDYLVVNTGHHIHILNVSIQNPNQPNQNISSQTNSSVLSNFHIKDEEPAAKLSNIFFNNDAFSEASETASDHCGVVDAILDNFSEYELDSTESGSKPFHELNISCEPLNVTGKSYHNTLVQQHIFDPRLKRLQQNSSKEYVFSMPQTSIPQKTPEKNRAVDKKIAEKAYEFIEENEKYEKISLFRKKRLADKKYEFSEDNTENIVPFHILRRERRYRLYRSQRTELNSLFLSPCSPVQSPGHFSPSGGGTPRHIYCTSSMIRSSPHPYHYSRSSPVSPRETRKINVYSPSLESDFSDSDSRLVIMRTATPLSDLGRCGTTGLLILDPKAEAPVTTPRWITKVVRRYSNGDFENSSLLSGQSRDDYNIPIEVPLLVQGLTEHFEMVPEYITQAHLADHRSAGSERHVLVTQRSMDCEQFVQRRSQALCSECNLEFMHCVDYDVKVVYVCPINGEILCQAVIKLGALKRSDPNAIVENYYAHFLFTWNIETDDFDIIDTSTNGEKLLAGHTPPSMDSINVPQFHCSSVWVLSYDTSKPSKVYLRDPKELYEICLRRSGSVYHWGVDDDFRILSD